MQSNRNPAYIGASSLMTTTHNVAEKTVAHSLFETQIMLGMTVAFFSAAFVENAVHWYTLTGCLMGGFLGGVWLIILVDLCYDVYKGNEIKISQFK